MKFCSIQVVLLSVVLSAAFCSQTNANPLPNEVLKFQQLPLNQGLAPSVGGAPYDGHDEWSTAYANFNTAGVLQNWRGTYMADDFGDKVSTPVVHIRWWGSYDADPTNGQPNYTGTNGVQQFLISFETDVPAQPGTFSHPGVPLLNQIVTKTVNPLTPGSGTFHESMINGNMPEHLFEYNAELSLPFSETAHDVYWLKIVALVDAANDGNINWGWHSRDWSIQDTYASTTAPSSPGETIIGSVAGLSGQVVPVWHYQDDAVTGPVDITPLATGGYFVDQFQTWIPQNYIDGIDGPLSPGGIGQFSKDLAFELYTIVPEPSSMVLFCVGAMACVRLRRRRSRN
jgi:hypothetical protein